jgi:hypothetical protein
MRAIGLVLLFGVLVAACAAPPSSHDGGIDAAEQRSVCDANVDASVATTPGVRGAPLAGALRVLVIDEGSLAPIGGAMVDLGGPIVTADVLGNATLATTTSSVTLTVRASGYIAERWIGVDRASVVVGMARPLVAAGIQGPITGVSGGTRVSPTVPIPMLRVASLGNSDTQCVADCNHVAVMFTVDAHADGIDIVILGHSSARIATDVARPSETFAIDAGAISASERLIMLQVVAPPAPGTLTTVVGVPGLSTPHGVARLDSFAGAFTTTAPAREGPMACDRLWYIVNAYTSDLSGMSALFDRDVGNDGVVHLPASFLTVPIATRSADVGITVDPAVTFYVVEAAHAGASTMRALVLYPSGSHIDVPIELTGATNVFVRAVDTVRSADGTIDLVRAEAQATRTATIAL